MGNNHKGESLVCRHSQDSANRAWARGSRRQRSMLRSPLSSRQHWSPSTLSMLEFVCSWWKIQQQNSPSYTFSELVVMIWLKSHSKCKWRKCCHSQFHYHHALTETATFWKGRKFVKYLLISYSNFAHLNSKGLSQGGTASWTSLYIVLDACGFIFFLC